MTKPANTSGGIIDTSSEFGEENCINSRMKGLHQEVEACKYDPQKFYDCISYGYINFTSSDYYKITTQEEFIVNSKSTEFNTNTTYAINSNVSYTLNTPLSTINSTAVVVNSTNTTENSTNIHTINAANKIILNSARVEISNLFVSDGSGGMISINSLVTYLSGLNSTLIDEVNKANLEILDIKVRLSEFSVPAYGSRPPFTIPVGYTPPAYP